jgi:hypothetical protein
VIHVWKAVSTSFCDLRNDNNDNINNNQTLCRREEGGTTKMWATAARGGGTTFATIFHQHNNSMVRMMRPLQRQQQRSRNDNVVVVYISSTASEAATTDNSTTTTTAETATPPPTKKYYAVAIDAATKNVGDHIGGEIVRPGMAICGQLGTRHPPGRGGAYFTCCGMEAHIGKEFDANKSELLQYHTETPCARFFGGRYHNGRLAPIDVIDFYHTSRGGDDAEQQGKDKNNGRKKNWGGLIWSCCLEDVTHRFYKGCRPIPKDRSLIEPPTPLKKKKYRATNVPT